MDRFDSVVFPPRLTVQYRERLVRNCHQQIRGIQTACPAGSQNLKVVLIRPCFMQQLEQLVDDVV